MRRVYRGQEFIYNENGDFYGINLGADFCAEHEIGIEDIKNTFKLDDSLYGLSKRLVRAIPETFKYFAVKIRGKMHYGIILFKYPHHCKEEVSLLEVVQCNLKPYDKEDIVTSWDRGSWGILVSKKYKKEIQTLYEAFNKKDVCIGVSQSQVFKNGGLTFLINSLVSDEIRSSVLNSDLSYMRLQKAFEKTKITKILKKAGKEYYALNPKWKDDNEDEIMYLLNPCDQNKYNFGWFSLQDLKDWAKGKGLIIKNGGNNK